MSAGLGESARRAQKTIYTNMSVKTIKQIIQGILIGLMAYMSLKMVWEIGMMVIEITKYK